MTDTKICDRCGIPIKSRHDLHVVRLILVNAGEGAPKDTTDITGDYHHVCAAYLFGAARGRDIDA